MTSDRSRRRRSRRRSDVKDRLIQTRVAEDLEKALKREAARRRLTVSHLIRNTLEDAFTLVEDVTTDVEQLVSGSVELAAAVGRDARRIAAMMRGHDSGARKQDAPASDAPAAPEPTNVAAPEQSPSAAPPEQAPSAAPERATDEPAEAPAAAEPDLDHVYGWNEIIANRAVACIRCASVIEKGDDALVGLSDDPSKPRAWLCLDCSEEMLG